MSVLNFDRIAKPYRMLEHLTMGRLLERTRFCFLPRMTQAHRALVLGDGDGRFLARLLAENHAVHATAVDLSAAMLQLLRGRCQASEDRLRIFQEDALSFCRRDRERYDLVVTHFFLDCLTLQQVEELARLLARRSEPGAMWVISEFSVPYGAAGLPAWVLVRGLYLAFRILTGLRVTRLPDYASTLTDAGFVRQERTQRLGGILRSEIWRLTPVP